MIKVQRVGEPTSFGKCDAPERAKEYWRSIIARQQWFDAEKEQLVVLLLSTRYNVQGYSLVSMGSLNESIAHPREVFRPAIANGAYAIILMHNHPSGDPSPSQSDHSLTRRMVEAGELLQLKLLDHIIVGSDEKLFSFREYI